MNTEALSSVYHNLNNDCQEYYDILTSQQKETIFLGEYFHLLDYLDTHTGQYCEASIVSLASNGNITVLDRELGEELIVYFSQLLTVNKLEILEIYENNNIRL